MAKARLLVRGDEDYLIVELHRRGHVSIQDFWGGHPRPPIVMNAKKAYALGEWLVKHAGKISGPKAHYDPAAEKAKERRTRARRTAR
jgi:hypothetical protein